MAGEKGMKLLRKDTGDEYIFLHYLTPVNIYLNGNWVRAEAGSCIFYDIHSYQYFISDECDLLHDWFHAVGDCAKVMKKFGLEFGRLYYPHDSKFITKIIKEIEAELSVQNPFYKEICACRAEELFAKIARNSSGDIKDSYIDPDTRRSFMALRAQVHREFDRNWNAESMAAAVNLSPSRFYNLYKEIFMISPRKDLINIRIEHAEMLLLHNSFPISRIAELVGYNNQYHFIRQFKEIKGVTPGEYRKNNIK
jgi:AraC-like DNA-binding protein